MNPDHSLYWEIYHVSSGVSSSTGGLIVVKAVTMQILKIRVSLLKLFYD